MSRYSGKCDVYDSLVMIHEYTDEELRTKVTIFKNDMNSPLLIKSRKDLIPYYAHIISSSCHNNVDRKATIFISSESWVDSEERSSLEWHLKYFLKIYNRCKRKKIEFDVEEALKEVIWHSWNEAPYRELAMRVKEHGKKATVDGIHLRIHEIYRKELAEEMIRNGLNPADYGLERFVEEVNKSD